MQILRKVFQIHKIIFPSLKQQSISVLRMVSSGMLRSVALVRTDVSEEPSASFIRVTRIGDACCEEIHFFAACVGC
jgi:hypothetical protein